MEQKHTPLPWAISANKQVVISKGRYSIYKRAIMPNLEEAEANAHLIVTAVNNHQKLIDAFKKLLQEYKHAMENISAAAGMQYSENAFYIQNKQLLHSLETESIKL